MVSNNINRNEKKTPKNITNIKYEKKTHTDLKCFEMLHRNIALNNKK